MRHPVAISWSPVAQALHTRHVKDYLAYLAGAVGLISAFLSFLSIRTARRGLALARVTGQASFEGTRFNREPTLDLVLSSVTFRGPTRIDHADTLLSTESEKWLEVDADHIEVVVHGRIRNNHEQELLLTLRGHPVGRRNTWQEARNHEVWRLDGRVVNLGRAMLAANSEIEFTWIDRRPPELWAAIYNLRAGSLRARPALKLPWLSISDWLFLARYPSVAFAKSLRMRKCPRIGFQIIAETRATERMATVWTAEIVATPTTTLDQRGDLRIGAVTDPWTIRGPIDDDVIHYRVSYDPVLAPIDGRRIVTLPGREP